MILYSKVSDLVDSDPVTLIEAKTHLEITGTSKDTMIATLISVSRELGEAYTGLSFVTQERVVKMDFFPTGEIIIPYGPVQSIDSFTYLNAGGTTSTLTENTGFYVDNHSGVTRLIPIENNELDVWPSDVMNRHSAITISYTAGFDDVSGVHFPKVAKQAMLMDIATFFEGRQNETGTESFEVSWGSRKLYDTIKVEWNANIDY